MSTKTKTSPGPNFFQLAYVSSAIVAFTDDELEELLVKSRSRNAASGVTGLLLYRGGNFMQFLEGPEEAVRNSMKRIEGDPRHRGVIVLLQEFQERRDFAEWSMGFKKLGNASDEELIGYSDFLDGPITGEEFVSNPTRSLQLLRTFRKNMR